MKETIPQSEIIEDIDCIIWSSKLTEIYRFTNQRFWETETKEHEYAMRIEGKDKDGQKTPRLESVAEHSWHIADIALILAPRFPELNIERCLALAILHDKLEIVIDDISPVGKNGLGTTTHAFNQEKRQKKDEKELEALEVYKKKLNNYAKNYQVDILIDAMNKKTIESKFIKAIDKMHPLIFILRKKKGNLLDDHIRFTLKYSATSFTHFPDIKPYYDELVLRLFKQVSKVREKKIEDIEDKFTPPQLEIAFE